MRKFSFVFCKVSHFSRKWMKQKCENDAKFREKNQYFFDEFSQNFSLLYFEFFREIFTFLISQKFWFFSKTDWSEISRKKQIFSNFSGANEVRKNAKIFASTFFFAKRFFLFAANPVLIKYNNIYKLHPDIHSRNS